MRVPVTDLVRKPGATRALVTRAAPEDVDAGASWGGDRTVSSPIELDLALESVVEGILVRGQVAFRVELECGRCLAPVVVDHVAHVAELFVDPGRREPDDEDDPGYEIEVDLAAIDLATMIRDTVSMAIPVQPRCRPDCMGLCPTCGTDRNLHDCGHRPESTGDPRWARLAELDLSASAGSGPPHDVN